jgi:hypothetical protein
MDQALDNSLAEEPIVAHKTVEGLIQYIVHCQLNKCKNNENVNQALKDAPTNLRKEKRAKHPSATNSAMANRKKSIQKLGKPHSASETRKEVAL